jgi:hypothetical protein
MIRIRPVGKRVEWASDLGVGAAGTRQWPADGESSLSSTYKAQFVKACLLADPKSTLKRNVSTQGEQTSKLLASRLILKTA